ncbi:TPA: acyltransferase family protein [Escherichia coli]|nr:acyltransferase family protein [Escherichia coli]
MNRNAGMDALRIISCFMVVCIHTCLNYKYSQDSLNNLLALFGQSLFRIGLPVFLFLAVISYLIQELTLPQVLFSKE